MHNRYITQLILITAIVFLCGCKDTDTPTPVAASFQLPSTVAEFKAQNNQPSYPSAKEEYFKENDQLGLFCSDSNHRIIKEYTIPFNSNKWNTDAVAHPVVEKSHRIVALYPAPARWQIIDARERRIVDYSLPADQSEKEYQKMTDMLYSVIYPHESNFKKIDFQHLLSSVVIVLNSTTYSKEELMHARISVASVGKAEIDLSDGSIRESQNINDLQTVTPCRISGSTYQAIVLPQSLGNVSKGKQMPWVKIEIAGNTYHYFAPLYFEKDYTPEIKPGHQITLNLTINRRDISGFTSTTRWIYGVNAPSPSDWTRGDRFMEDYPCITWDRGRELGIFDAKKSNPYGEAGKEQDTYQCWVASTANIIDWWLHQNKQMIDRYGYHGPFEVTGPENSEVFRELSANLPAAGSFPKYCLYAFFKGYEKEDGTPYGGYFKDFLGTRNPYEETTFPDSPVSFNLFNHTIREAIRSKKAIQWSTMAHALTAWGADFNDKGEVEALYYVDNNDLYTARSFVMGLKKTRIYLKGNEIWAEHAEDYSPQRIYSIITLDLMQKEWEQYFKH